ncbi:hypothetical protein NP493_595g01045 [Ridgeia piscesae]|uniref:Secreted protein n=1 Tax=Ridgeia piscesae TaxID=27915 RepID=A0AAD9KUD6_RIDPI|nr:hypothetical protein NP493_595g01045 [Ridgeia piscesae]
MMAAVRLYVTLAVVLLATCFHTGHAFWWSRSSCSRVHCRWLSWSSWGSCSYYCSKYNMQKRTRSHTSRSCGGRSCSGPSKQIRICSCGYGQCMTFPESAVRSIPSQCC